MRRDVLQKVHLLLVVVGMLLCGQALADKPSWAGGGAGKAEKHDQKKWHQTDGGKGGGHEEDRPPDWKAQHGRERGYFDDRQRTVVREYYSEQFRAGRCPPGLAKKGNGCLPPGQAKKWSIGRPLSRDVVYYDLPHSVSVQIGLPPAGYRYVRVANDILMIATGTRMVMDAIVDLGRP